VKNANKRGVYIRAITAMAVLLAASAAQALDAHSNTKVNNAKAKAWTASNNDKKDPALQKQVVNIGSKRDNTCNVNVGTAPAAKTKYGQKAPKEIIVTTKEVINVCK
jgi:hypothetical protein